MPSRSNPNMPSKAKRKTASVLTSKRKNNQRLVNNKISKQITPRTSQALRQAAPLSRKKARKLMKKGGYDQQRKELEQFLEAEVEMKDLDGKAARKQTNAETGKEDVEMEVD
ncbi:MAG: hypothetical protein L6R40_003710 [Gallowayella cf. fulva]|nr:MAG: hypothetical protein L6R40_003710 [Xanthomendoza cf. fulva]